MVVIRSEILCSEKEKVHEQVIGRFAAIVDQWTTANKKTKSRERQLINYDQPKLYLYELVVELSENTHIVSRTLRKVHGLIFDSKACHLSNLGFLDRIWIVIDVTYIAVFYSINHWIVWCSFVSWLQLVLVVVV